MDIVWQSEDSLREKKVESDLKDLLKTLVAFANSVRPGDTAILYIGEKNDGTVQGVKNADNIQKTVKMIADKIYPEIYYHTSAYERDGKQCVRVEVKHNGLAPHFGGAAWVRKGSVTVQATEQLYQQMVELRQSKVFILSQWLGKEVTVFWRVPPMFSDEKTLYTGQEFAAKLVVVNGFWVTFNVFVTGTEISEPTQNLLLSWDDKNKHLRVLVDEDSRPSYRHGF